MMSGQPTGPNAAKRLLPAEPKTAGFVALAFTVLLYLVELVDTVLPAELDQGGIAPRSVGGLDGILWAPMLHAGWGHLLSNTIPVLVFAFLAMAGGLRLWIVVTATIWIVGGFGVWVTAEAGTYTVGASGLAFGWLAFLLVRGIFNRSGSQLLLAAMLLFIWGGMLWGVLPGNVGVSWQGHLFGALAGVLAAWIVGRFGRRPRKAPPGGSAHPDNLGL
jgi:membrane associated rhomboid family serine protease